MSVIINKDQCVGCRKCKEVCPGNLIKIDEKNKGDITYWNIEKTNGEKVTIEVNRNNANAY